MILQVDLCAEELHNSVPATVAIQVKNIFTDDDCGHNCGGEKAIKWKYHKGDLGPTVSAIGESLGGWSHSSSSPWWKNLR